MTKRKTIRDKLGRGDPARGGLSPEDADLWARVAGGAKPLPKRGRPVETPTAPSGGSEPAADREDGAPPSPLPPSRRQDQAGSPARPVLPPLAPGAAPGVDRRTADRLRRGQMPIQARLDLHGMTQDEAHAALADFVPEARAAGLRTVIVVTGKGRRSERGGGAGSGRGVLWQMVPRWLNDADLRPHILAFAHARPRDGGDGALYVLLRRMRD